MRVWIDGDLCTGVAICESSCPEVFAMADDGIAHVRNLDGDIVPSGTSAEFREQSLDGVLEAAEGCPEECIYIEA